MSIDINGLKIVNDTYRHSKGDELIEASSSIIENIFKEYGKCFKVGGDEFVSLINTKEENIELVINSLLEKQKEHGISFSFSYALAKENENLTIEELINLADKMMYKNKNSRHQII